MSRVLLLGGTAEARALADELVARGDDVTTSLAGRVARPRLPVGAVRVGGFGGPEPMADHLRGEAYDVVVDATHPFAARISANAVTACARARVPLVRLARPGWAGHPDAGSWHWVDGHDEAARTARGLVDAAGPDGGAVLLTTGRQHVDAFTGPLADRAVVVRLVDPPEVPLPPAWTVLRSRGPYALAAERALLAEHAVAVLVTKDSGGDHTVAKLTAAAERGAAVVVVRRPAWPGTGPVAPDVPGTLALLADLADLR